MSVVQLDYKLMTNTCFIQKPIESGKMITLAMFKTEVNKHYICLVKKRLY